VTVGRTTFGCKAPIMVVIPPAQPTCVQVLQALGRYLDERAR
jgi:hypothetical protein